MLNHREKERGILTSHEQNPNLKAQQPVLDAEEANDDSRKNDDTVGADQAIAAA